MSEAKRQKYDRQLRLWEGRGQTSLERTNVCLVNATVVGSEALKNLILPGIGSFTVLDGEIVTEDDVKSNFFLTTDDIGHSRAERTKGWLNELNEDVRGRAIYKPLSAVIDKDIALFSTFSLVILTGWMGGKEGEAMEALVKYLDQAKIPYIRAWSNGFLGGFRLVLHEHTVVESHPEIDQDLRLDCPWPELQAVADGIDFEKIDSFHLAHIPWALIILRKLREWKEAHGGALPNPGKEREEFKSGVRSLARVGTDDENINEAIDAAPRSCNPTKIPTAIKLILEDPATKTINEATPLFWVIARAIREAMEDEEGELYEKLPLPGNVPDMKADTVQFVSLQNMYRKRAQRDVEEVYRRVHTLLPHLHTEDCPRVREKVELWCRYAAHVHLIRYTGLHHEEGGDAALSRRILRWLGDEDEEMGIYLAMRSVELFYQAHGRVPGSISGDDEEAQDMRLLKTEARRILHSWGIEEASIAEAEELIDKYLAEVYRSGGIELHSISALIGGLVAQESIKCITHQYIPLDNTCLYNGIRASVKVYAL